MGEAIPFHSTRRFEQYSRITVRVQFIPGSIRYNINPLSRNRSPYISECDAAPRRNAYAFARGQATCRPRFLPLWSPCYETLQYPLLFLHGEAGWTPGGPQDDYLYSTTSVSGRKVPLNMYYRQRVLAEPQFHRLGRVMQEWACDQLSRWEENTSSYLESPAGQRRIAPYHEIMSNDVGEVGKLLPKSFPNHPAQR